MGTFYGPPDTNPVSNNQSINQSLYFQDQQDYRSHLHEENQENQMEYKFKTNVELNLTKNVFISLGISHILDHLQESSLSCIVFSVAKATLQPLMSVR